MLINSLEKYAESDPWEQDYDNHMRVIKGATCPQESHDEVFCESCVEWYCSLCERDWHIMFHNQLVSHPKTDQKDLIK